jgi:hypothetical protein
MQTDLNEIFRFANDIIQELFPMIAASAALFFSLHLFLTMKRILYNVFDDNYEQEKSDPRNYYLRDFDEIAETIKKLSPPENLLKSLPVYRQSLENISNINTERTNDASAQIIAMVTDLLKKLTEAQAIKAISKNKSILYDLSEQVQSLDDRLSAMIEIKLDED